MLVKPLALVDLDDTLFQTARHHVPLEQLKHVASLNKSGEPLGLMTDRQQQFWQWLDACTEVIPVTARTVTGLARVQLPFHSVAVCMHGAVVLDAARQLDPVWSDHVRTCLRPIHPLLDTLLHDIQAWLKPVDGGHAWMAAEREQPICVMVKQPQRAFFNELVAWLQPQLCDDFYIHINGQTMAILPTQISKARAAEYVLQRLDPERQRVVLGWADSLSDLPFLQHCDWWGVPQRSQAAAWTHQQLDQYVRQTGAYQFHGR